MFLSQTGISDIYECKDGSFIALMSAGFSLLKISKDGKPLWLKSTVFDEFNILYTRAWSDKYILNKSDTFYIENYKNGGGIYIPTYNVYETDDGGYMAIGNNRYSYKPFLTKLCEGSDCDKKAFFYHSTGKDGNEIKSFIHPDRVYVYREYTLNDEEKPQIQKRSTTVVVKTDKNGNVLWKRQFGNMSYDTHPHSDLVKLAGGKWLVRIRDCSDMGTKDVYGNINWGSPHPEFFLLDNNGNILKRPHFGPSKYICDPMGMALAPDSTYYFYEQDVVSKTDTKMRIQWQRGFGGWLTDYGIHAVTADNGILSTERGIIYKFDPYGNLPQDTIGIDISKAILPRDNTGKTKSYAHISFYAPAVTELKNVVIEPKDASKIKDEDIICYSYIIEDHSFGSREENALENKKKYLKSGKTEKKYKMPWYMFISEINVGKYDPSLNSYTLDLNDTCQLRGMFCEQKQDTLPAVMVNIPYLYGYREVYLGDLAPGNYVCKITIMLSNKENKTWQKEFTWKP